MGDLIVMTRPTGPSRRQPPLETGADVLFFTGVRYVRLDGDAASAPAPQGARRQTKSKKPFQAPSPLTV